MSSNLHFIGLSETWLNDKIPNNILKLSNDYSIFRNDRTWSEEGNTEPKKGGGVALYIKNTLKFSENTYKHLNTSNKDIESQWITIMIPNSKPILISNIYRPPQGNIESFNQVLDNVFTEKDLSKFEFYLMGDLNIDMLDKQSDAYRKFTTLIKPMGLRQLIKNPTRFSAARDSPLDLCITNSDFIKRSGVCDINIF